MEPDRHYWVLDPKILEYLKFVEFRWWEIFLFLGGLGALALYFLLAIYIDSRARALERRQRQLTRLDGWLKEWRPHPPEMEVLHLLAGSEKPSALYRLLSDPQRLEGRVHETDLSGAGLAFVQRIRDNLRYRSDNLRIRITSTRQLLPGDYFRFAVWEGGRPQQHYGHLAANDPSGLTVELTAEGYHAVRERSSETDLFYLRGHDIEYRFPFAMRGGDEAARQIVIAHSLVMPGQRGRGARIPLLRPVTFQVRSDLAYEAEEDGWNEAENEVNLDLVPAREMRGVLLEISEGGFSLEMDCSIEPGSYVEFSLPRAKGRQMAIMGRVLDCRSLGGTVWQVRCELRGMNAAQRNTLAQLLRLVQQHRLKRGREKQKKMRQSSSSA